MDDLQLLEAMLRTTSLSGQEGALAALLCQELRQRGFTAGIDEVGNIVGERGDAGSGPTLLLLGHMDTVPGAVPVRHDGDRLYGRGAVDAKGPLAAFIAAATGFDGPGRVLVIGAVEEEAATSRGARHALRLAEPDWAVIGEPSNWDRLTVGYKGRLLARYQTTRSMSHTAAAHRSAPETAVHFWQRLEEAVRACNETRPVQAFEQLQCSLRAMQSFSDGLAETAALEIGFRLPLGFDVVAWELELRECAAGASLECYAYESAVRVEKNTALARALLSGIRAQQGVPRFVVKTGTSDLNVLAAHWHCPMLAYGPGDSAYDHTPDEHILISEYLRAIAVLRAAIAHLFGLQR